MRNTIGTWKSPKTIEDIAARLENHFTNEKAAEEVLKKHIEENKVENPYRGISEADTSLVNRIALTGNAPRYANDQERQAAWNARREALEQEEREKVKKLKGLWNKVTENELSDFEEKLSEKIYQ